MKGQRPMLYQRRSDPERHVSTILTALSRSQDGMSRTQISDLFNRHLSQKDIHAALLVLQDAAKAHCIVDYATGGAPRETWHATDFPRGNRGKEETST